MPLYMQWTACIIALAGASLIALNNPDLSKWAFVAYFVADVLWLGYGLSKKMYSLVAQHTGFLLTTLVGFINWFN